MLQFGVAASPVIWQRAMDQVLQGIPFTSCVLDDMIISGNIDEEHLTNLNTVLEHLERFGLRANMNNVNSSRNRCLTEITLCRWMKIRSRLCVMQQDH